MEIRSLLLGTLLFGMMGCGGEKEVAETMITVDVTQSYPKKSLVLQDFLQVEYVPLELTDEFVTNGQVKDVTAHYIVITNGREGEVLLFDRATGKGVKKINRRGQGPEEYLFPINALLDESAGELFINDGPSSRIQVYDLSGNYKRSISYRKGAFVSNIYKYDSNYLLCQDTYAPENTDAVHTFFLLAKTGDASRYIEIPYEKKISTVIVKQVGNMVYGNGPRNSMIVPHGSDWILTEPSADTIYTSMPEKGIHPFIVRTPSVQTMAPEVFLFPGVLTDRYYFMQAITKECDVEKNEEMPKVDLVYDREQQQIYQVEVRNQDYKNRIEDMAQRSIDPEILLCTTLQAADLVEANGKGELQGQLKAIASQLDEEDNPVIMLVKQP